MSTAILHHMSPSCSLVSTQISKPRRHISRCHISQSLRVETTALHDQNPRISDTRDVTSHDRCGSKPSPGTIKTPRISDTRQAYLDAIVSRARTMGRRSHLPYGFAESGAANLCQWQASHHRCVFLPVRQTAGLLVRSSPSQQRLACLALRQLASLLQARKTVSRSTVRSKTYIQSRRNFARLRSQLTEALPTEATTGGCRLDAAHCIFVPLDTTTTHVRNNLVVRRYRRARETQ